MTHTRDCVCAIARILRLRGHAITRTLRVARGDASARLCIYTRRRARKLVVDVRAIAHSRDRVCVISGKIYSSVISTILYIHIIERYVFVIILLELYDPEGTSEGSGHVS